MRYTVPLDGGREAILWLPRELRSEDAARMGTFIYALVIEEIERREQDS